MKKYIEPRYIEENVVEEELSNGLDLLVKYIIDLKLNDDIKFK